MLAMKYNITARYMDGVKVLGYLLETTEGTQAKVTKKKVEELALNKQILNCVAQRYEDGVVLKGVDCKISKIRNIYLKKENETVDTRGEIIARVVSGKSTLGYIIRTFNGDEKTVSRAKTLEIARKGLLRNARAQQSNDKMLLRGVNCELAKLQTIKVEEMVGG